MYQQIKDEFEQKFRENNLNFTEHYMVAYGKAKNKPSEEAKELIRKLLKAVLKKYSDTEGKTIMGRFFRFLSSIFSK
jgi:CRISPR/Cas system CSM-associated protein Csm2 small subunit